MFLCFAATSPVSPGESCSAAHPNDPSDNSEARSPRAVASQLLDFRLGNCTDKSGSLPWGLTPFESRG